MTVRNTKGPRATGARPKASGKGFWPINTSQLTAKAQKTLIELFTELLRPYAMPPTYLHEVLHEAAGRAGWRPPTAEARLRQKKAAAGRTTQRRQQQWERRIRILQTYINLPKRLQGKRASAGTAQAIINRLYPLLGEKTPPEGTVKADLLWLRVNGYIFKK